MIQKLSFLTPFIYTIIYSRFLFPQLSTPNFFIFIFVKYNLFLIFTSPLQVQAIVDHHHPTGEHAPSKVRFKEDEPTPETELEEVTEKVVFCIDRLKKVKKGIKGQLRAIQYI